MSNAFDLDQFAPPPVRFTLRGVEYVVDGDPDIDLVTRMLRIEDALETDQAVAAAFEGRDLILELVQVRRPDVTELKMSAREILSLFYLLMRGESVAAVVAASLTNPDAKPPVAPRGEEEAVITAENGGDGAGETPLVSERSSLERSSSSEDETAGVLVTGTA